MPATIRQDESMTTTDLEEYDLRICTDCLVWIANGDLSGLEDDEAEALLARIEEEWPSASDSYWYVAPTGEGEGEFSWRPCGYCGSELGGQRHEAIIWRRSTN